MNSAKDTAAQVRGGLPHSEIPGSPIARISPGLFAACCVLHRLSVPRHPPDALLFARSQDIARQARPCGRPRLRHPGTRRAQGQAPTVHPTTGPPQKGAPAEPHRTRPPPGPAFHEDTSPDGVSPPPPLAPQTHGDPWPRAQSRVRPASAAIRLGHIHQFVSPRQSTPPRNSTRRHRPREPGLLRMSFPGIRSQGSGSRSKIRLATPDSGSDSGQVEVNGIEPMTSCLQSRRSPN